MVKVLVNGALGRMGTEVCKKVWAEEGLELVGAVDIKQGVVTLEGTAIPCNSDLVAAINMLKPDVVVDFTRPDVVMGTLRKILPMGVHCVVGTTGFKPADLEEVDALAKANNTGLLIAPNFALGAVVMMKLACEAAKYFSDVEIIEKHHDQKLDAPSGTAIITAQKIASGKFRQSFAENQQKTDEAVLKLIGHRKKRRYSDLSEKGKKKVLLKQLELLF
mgnify:CR=1 FL=1